MKTISGKKLCKLVKDRGWELKRINGSHHIFAKVGKDARISIPVHGNKPLKLGLQRHLMKVAGIDEAEL